MVHRCEPELFWISRSTLCNSGFQKLCRQFTGLFPTQSWVTVPVQIRIHSPMNTYSGPPSLRNKLGVKSVTMTTGLNSLVRVHSSMNNRLTNPQEQASHSNLVQCVTMTTIHKIHSCILWVDLFGWIMWAIFKWPNLWSESPSAWRGQNIAKVW